jgi:hypothetical protein
MKINNTIDRSFKLNGNEIEKEAFIYLGATVRRREGQRSKED